MKYRLHGKERLFSIGVCPDVSLAQARKAKKEERSKVAASVDPSEAKQIEKRVKREEAGARFLDKQRKAGKSKVTFDKTEYHLKPANRDFGRRPIIKIAAPLTPKSLRKVEAKGNYETAHRLRARIGSVFGYAVASGIAENDLTYALRDALIRPTRIHRAAITDPKALGRLMNEIDGLDGQAITRIALKRSAVLAQRPREIRHAKRAEIDFTNKVWPISAEKMKMRRDHLVPLPARALALLDQLRRMNGNGEYLFPSLRTWKRPLSESALRRMGYSGDDTLFAMFADDGTPISETGRSWVRDNRRTFAQMFERRDRWYLAALPPNGP